jgi:hypothetical protein
MRRSNLLKHFFLKKRKKDKGQVNNCRVKEMKPINPTFVLNVLRVNTLGNISNSDDEIGSVN